MMACCIYDKAYKYAEEHAREGMQVVDIIEVGKGIPPGGGVSTPGWHNTPREYLFSQL